MIYMFQGVQLILEVKPLSPFGFRSDLSWDQLFDLANEYADIISVHTDPRWGGSMDLIAEARGRTTKPILAKGIHATDDLVIEALAAGADYVLVVGRVPRVNPGRCLIEPNTISELTTLSSDTMTVWNSRDLATGGFKEETFAQARAAFSGWLCQASNLRTISDIEPGANAVLVGQNLPEFVTSLKISKG